MVLKKTLESPLDCKEIQPVHPKGESWSLLEGLMLKLKLQYFGHLMQRIDSLEKDPDAGKDWSQEEKGMTEDEMVGWHHWLDGHEFEQTLGDSEVQGKPGCYSPWGRKALDTTVWLSNWTELTITKAAKWGLKSQKQIQHKFINSSLLQWVLSLCSKGLLRSHNSLVLEEWSLSRGISAAQKLLAVFCDCPAVWADAAICVWWLRPATCGL